ncbi:DnaB-like helicase C-terminal domain-containing protein [Sphingomonas sp. 3-13AW]|uniref:DnaB-like helicase C-terminal domain-containing protein n=1 Tax=Sphingomonas sp. 3-13AW TaxID=3050450 RepID=UPI003BB55CB1
MTDEEELRPRTEATEAEQEVLGSLVNEPALLHDLQNITADDFGTAAHRAIWRAILRLAEDRDDITARAVTSLCGGDLNDERRDYVQILADRSSASRTIVLERSSELLEASRRRRFIEALDRAKKVALHSDDSVDSLVARTTSLIDRSTLSSRNRFMSGRQASERLKAEMKSPRRKIPTLIDLFDRTTNGGLHSRRMFNIGAKSKTGKTTFISTLSYNLCAQEVPHLVITLERSDTDLERMCAARALAINADRLESDFARFESRYDAYTASPARQFAYYLHCPGATIDNIRHDILMAKRLLGIDAFFLDYYQLIEPAPRESQHASLARAAQVLANLTNQLELASVVTSQIDADGVMPRDCKVLYQAAAANFMIRRGLDQTDAWLENVGGNFIEKMNAGGPKEPAMTFDKAEGPHFRST